MVAALLCLPMVTGCYQYRPTSATIVSPDTQVELGINDRGRLMLGDRLGAGVRSVEGLLVGHTDSTYVVHVEAVDFLQARRVRWSGEEVTLPVEVVSTLGVRKLSRGRTLGAIGALVAAMVVIIGSVSLISGGSEGGGTKLPGDPNAQ